MRAASVPEPIAIGLSSAVHQHDARSDDSQQRYHSPNQSHFRELEWNPQSDPHGRFFPKCHQNYYSPPETNHHFQLVKTSPHDSILSHQARGLYCNALYQR